MSASARFRSVVLILCLAGGLPASMRAQTENPVQKSQQAVETPVPVSTTRGDITPLFWKATIDDAIVTIPLRNVEHFGIQDYEVDGVTRVRELAITTVSRSMVRIYHIQPIGPIDEAAERVKQLRRIAEGVVDANEEEIPVKVFPSTTHVPMVEYRVSKEEIIDALYESLEGVMIDYHARTLIPEQREQTVREVSVDQ